MNRELLALFVHDIKNQLGVLEAELFLLEAEPDRPRAHRAHQHCSQLRQRLIAYLTLYASDDRPMSAQAEDESPLDFLHKLLKVDSRPDGTPLRLGDCTEAPPFWYFDARLVLLAMEAALHNAWRFARSDVQIGAKQIGSYLVFSVEDDGLGLGAKDPSSRSSTGLGMELCAAVARAHKHGEHQGRVTLEPRPQGGTKFEIWLP
ncbi:sensor histidine kinase [Roseateles oligotrophus]|uniref:histidine kinase n=1 Tax=Roseateles oligotrophus TaxID=1769250 RepID=A0ABT2YHH8_9BURK|nr:HAMP domain-containing sensor histidine kinase [Roseateles oligotrophus]MCV2369415.1 HAMP domain-containing histidine kinase [Roseateles oligotrophus]